MNTDARTVFYAAILLATFVLLYLLAPVLTPFMIAAILSYMTDPLVDRLEKKISRSWAVSLVFISLFTFLTVILLLVIPLLEEQIASLVSSAPAMIERFQALVTPWLQQQFGIADPVKEGFDQLKQLVVTHWQQTGSIIAGLLSSFSNSGIWLVAWFGNLILVPVVTFYLLRDWDVILNRLRELLPRHLEPGMTQLVKEADQVLGAFLRGQLLVMLSLSLIYGIGLWLVDVNFGVLIGVVSGLLSFVPYLGLILGFAVASLAALIQHQDMTHIIFVAVVFGFAQLVESLWLTPLLVGDRIGLHPVAVLFAVLTGGQLFGFFGILLALPVAAVVMVLIRFAHERYLASRLYSSGNEDKP